MMLLRNHPFLNSYSSTHDRSINFLSQILVFKIKVSVQIMSQTLLRSNPNLLSCDSPRTLLLRFFNLFNHDLVSQISHFSQQYLFLCPRFTCSSRSSLCYHSILISKQDISCAFGTLILFRLSKYRHQTSFMKRMFTV